MCSKFWIEKKKPWNVLILTCIFLIWILYHYSQPYMLYAIYMTWVAWPSWWSDCSRRRWCRPQIPEKHKNDQKPFWIWFLAHIISSVHPLGSGVKSLDCGCTLAGLPPKMQENVNRIQAENVEFKLKIFDDTERREFTTIHFEPSVVNAYGTSMPGA